jgi:predicted Zn-dependent peptidase
VWVRTGGRYEPLHQSGVSHFIEHLVFKGTQHYTCEGLKHAVEGVGGTINAFTSEELTCFMAKLPAGYAQRGLDVLADMVALPRLSAGDFERERAVILEEIRMYEDAPGQLVFDRFHQLLWPQHPLGALLSGTQQTVQRLEHAFLKEYWRRTYHPANWVVVAVGAFDPYEVEATVIKRLGRFKPRPALRPRPAPSPWRQTQVRVVHKPVEQVHVCLGGYAGSRFDPDRFALELLNIVLGANTSSRLFRQIREQRALVYDISSQVKRYSDTGAYLIYAGCDAGKLNKTLSLIRREVGALADRAITAAELRRARDFYCGQFQLSLEDTLEHMLWLGEQMVTVGSIASAQQLIKRLHAVTTAGVQRAAQRLFKRPMHLSAVGPVAPAIGPELKGLLR